ncbi:hypothetical protein FB45DRAFT_864670 [Roridomyces roridus]|uniref:Uncharacterized protein n=1 Tax=Roridomyces roridus TaxID=1738132 RepID=A0AAD7C1B2_9AGAR|nr:hypothetical protein FB45DRAFT_864670 [Roridomyces roridus]
MHFRASLMFLLGVAITIVLPASAQGCNPTTYSCQSADDYCTKQSVNLAARKEGLGVALRFAGGCYTFSEGLQSIWHKAIHKAIPTAASLEESGSVLYNYLIQGGLYFSSWSPLRSSSPRPLAPSGPALQRRIPMSGTSAVAVFA